MRLITSFSSRIGSFCGLLLVFASLGLFTNYLHHTHAAAPLTAGEPLNQIKKLIANDGTYFDGFYVTAISNDTIVVGANGNNTGAGSAYIFEHNQSGADNWGLVKKLTASDAEMGDAFGAAIGISGNTIVVGAYQNNSHRGAAYVFERNQGGAGNWGQVKKLVASDAADPDFFASAIVIQNDTVVIGAYHKQFFTGAAYIFGRNQGGAGNWGQVKKLVASDAALGDSFGSSVAISDDTIAIGANGKNANTGAAYVFGRNQGGADVWGQVKKLALGDGMLQDVFGCSIGISGDTIVVGAYGRNSGSGAAYIFERNQGGAGNWGQVQVLTANNGAEPDRFGVSVGIRGDIVAVGSDLSNVNTGAAYLFGRNQGGTDNWGQTQKLTAGDGAAFDYFGATVGISGDSINGYRVIVGAIYANNQAGAAYLFSNLCSTPSLTPASLPIAQVGVPYSQTVTALPSGSYTYAVSSGVLPDGLTLSSATGVISGTPSHLGIFNFRVTAISRAGCAGFLDYTIHAATCAPITVNPAVLTNGAVGTAYSQTITATPSLPYSFSITSGALPAGISLNAATGVISGTPTITDVYSFRVTAMSGGCTGYRDYTVTINGGGGGATGLQFYPLAHPVRLLDTRVGASGCDAPGAMIAGGASRTQTAAGRTCDGLTIPANARALTGNITTVESGGGFLTLFPSDAAKPLVANSNFTPNQIVNNVFTVGLGAGNGAFKIFV
ncbi:MAG: putative Ig domain-containing protein, partial [Acidobacteriota bacterium]